MFRVLLLSVLSAYAITVQAQVHKCIGPNGKTTYSQAPCPAGSKSGEIRHTIPPAAPPAAPSTGKADAEKASGPKTAADLEKDFRKRRQEQEKDREKAAQEQENARIRERNCRNARQHVAALNSGAPLARIDAKGNRTMLTDSQREQEKVFANKAIDEWCK